jgi:hypothetical protein
MGLTLILSFMVYCFKHFRLIARRKQRLPSALQPQPNVLMTVRRQALTLARNLSVGAELGNRLGNALTLGALLGTRLGVPLGDELGRLETLGTKLGRRLGRRLGATLGMALRDGASLGASEPRQKGPGIGSAVMGHPELTNIPATLTAPEAHVDCVVSCGSQAFIS